MMTASGLKGWLNELAVRCNIGSALTRPIRVLSCGRGWGCLMRVDEVPCKLSICKRRKQLILPKVWEL